QNISPVNGRAVTADDIAYSYERIRALQRNAGQLGGIESWEVIDPQTIRLNFGRPDADGLASLCNTYLKIVAHEAVEVNGDLENGPTIGSGPWIQRKWEPNQVIEFDRNPDYWKSGDDGQ